MKKQHYTDLEYKGVTSIKILVVKATQDLSGQINRCHGENCSNHNSQLMKIYIYELASCIFTSV